MKIYVLFIFLSIVFFSCRKEVPIKPCTQNCKTYNIKGKFYDGINNVGFANMPIELKWVYFRYCWFCPRVRKVYSGSSDENGNFNFSIEIDTSIFNDYSLELSSSKVNNYYEFLPRTLDQEDLNNDSLINIDYYPRGNFKLNLHKTGTDSIITMSVTHYWKTNRTGEFIYRQDYFGQSPNVITDSTFNIETVAEIETKVVITKIDLNRNRIDIRDSITCNRNSTSILNMNY